MSYQKEGNGAAYEPIEGGPKRGSKKWIYGIIVVVIAGVAGFYMTHKTAGAATDAAVAKAGIAKGKDGRLKLFDEHSK